MCDDEESVRAFLCEWAKGREIETHAARVYLGEDTALKVKRPVRYEYLDFTDPAVRKQVLTKELDLNRSAAPGIYRDVVPITRNKGRLSIGGSGDVVEWALRMWRFPEEAELGRIAATGRFDMALAEALGHVVFDLHRKSAPADVDGSKLIHEILDGFECEFARVSIKGVKLPVTRVLERAYAALSGCSSVLTTRTRQGAVRRCHGDLHLRNIVVLDGLPVPFDALEFSERLATCDVLYDLAFLLMDILQSGLAQQANRVLNAYLEDEPRIDALAGLTALPLFLAARALVRAVVCAGQAALDQSPEAFARAEVYLARAEAFLVPPQPALFVVAGLSGTGKTTVAREIAPEIGPHCGALLFRSDVERKRVAGVPPLTRLSPESYTPQTAAMVYSALFSRAEQTLAAGMPVVLDAVFGRPEERAMAETLARRMNVPFRGIWLDASETLRSERVATRRGDASDATIEVVRRQSGLDTGPIAWRRWDATRSPDILAARILSETLDRP